jgi:MFS family permease
MMSVVMIKQLRPHRAWSVAAVAFIAIIGAAGFRATPGVLIDPLHRAFGWSTATISAAVSVNLIFFGLTAPFAAALMDRFGMRRVVTVALVLVSLGSGLTVFMTASWQLVLCWGVLVGLGTGSMALVFVATVTGRWFVRHRGVVTGVLTAAGATGQLIFLPVLAALVSAHGWRSAGVTVALAALAVVPLVAVLLRDWPADVGLQPYGADPALAPPTAPGRPARRQAARGDVGAAGRALRVLATASRQPSFWLLVGGFAICGASTNGLIATHFIPAAHDHGLGETTAAGLLALVGVFDIVGTVVSGALTDRVDSRVLLGAYYTLRGVSLLALPGLLGSSAQPSLLVFIVFYGLDWVATVPPTIALCRKHFGADGAVVFGWVFASHQLGAAVAATGAGLIRDATGDYTTAFVLAGTLCFFAAVMSVRIRATAVAPTLAPA